jgi:erythromycin esterase-like protein
MYDHDYENAFSTEQNALTAVNAEKYYRAMVQGGGASWNVRDQHMQETLERLLDFHGTDAKAIVWEHNTHIGDASFTDMAESGMHNIGQLARKKYGKDEVVLVGFGSYEGTVIAGDDWGELMEVMDVPEGKKGSWEYLLHQCGGENMLLLMEDFKGLTGLEKYIGHRAIGVVYNPKYEYGNYVPSILPNRYDAFVYIDQTQALHPLHIRPEGGKIPETYPFGL